MIPFKNVTLADRPVIERFTLSGECENAALSFDNVWEGRHETNARYAIVEGMLVFRFETDGRFTYSMPLGRGNLRFALMQMMEDADTMRMSCRLSGLTEKDIDAVKTAMPGYYAFEEENGADCDVKKYRAVPLTNYTNSIFFNNEGMVPPP
jgi:hypothetical protein